MKISKNSLLRQSGETGFRAEILEKVWRLMNVLEGIQEHPFLQDRLVLKGGTALNLFIFDLPRLSVDIDLNYIGAVDREAMLEERPQIEKALESVFQRENLSIRRIPSKHAGGKWQLKYLSALGNFGNLEVDLNYMFRSPLWEVKRSSSVFAGGHKIEGIPILDLHELSAGKFTALFARSASRDFFDVHHLLTKRVFDIKKMRLAFILYIGMSSIPDIQAISATSLHLDELEFERQLVPVLRKGEKWDALHLQECKESLSILFPFSEKEKEFLKTLGEEGEINPALLTDCTEMQENISQLPLLRWRVARVRSDFSSLR
ncbi:MAG: nucleotidyl transferase AbiEii/AbiGii toxin family protein [Simkaniaceae bacterium]|nr:nucleotidyl transferase AbiEii/AbiGii toxin family protein [Candidatus Sacchlamyda saccharinae]